MFNYLFLFPPEWKKWCKLPLPVALINYFAIVIISLALKAFIESNIWLIFLHISTALLFIFLWRYIDWDKLEYECFGAILLLSSAGYRLLSSLDTILYGSSFPDTRLMVRIYDPLWIIFRGEVISFIGIMLIVFSWQWSVGHRKIDLSIFSGIRPNMRVGIIVYIVGLVIEITRRVLQVDMGHIGQLIPVIYASGVGAVLVIVQSSRINAEKKPFITLLLVLPFSILAFTGGMKENIIFPIIPAVFLAWQIYRSLFSRALIIVGLILFIVTLQLYVTYTRSIVWIQDETISLPELVSSYYKQSDDSDLYKGFKDILNRINMTNSHALTIAVTDEDGFKVQEFIDKTVTIMIPRVFWEDKPIFQPGLEHSVRLYGDAMYLRSVQSATSAGFFTELYMYGGLYLVVFGSIILGFIYAKSQLLVAKIKMPIALSIFNFFLFVSALRLDERSAVYAFSGAFASVLYFIAYIGIVKMLLQIIPFSPEHVR